MTELPDVLMNFRRRKRVNEVWTLGSGAGYCLLGLGIAAIAYKGAMENNLKRLERLVGGMWCALCPCSLARDGVVGKRARLWVCVCVCDRGKVG